MLKKGLLTTFLVLALMTAAGTAEASVGKKALTVDYNNVQINVNGSIITFSPDQEPFIFNGITFLPLRVVAEALNCNVDWQGDTSTVVINSKTSPEVINLRLQLTQKDQELQSLKQQVAQLQRELAAIEEESSDLGDLEDELLDDYDSIGDVDLDDLELDGDEDSVEVEVWVDLDEYEDEWADLSDDDIEDWLEELVEDIQDELSEDTEVYGEILNSVDDDTLVEFYKDGDDDLEIDYEDEDYRESGDADEAIDELEGQAYYVGDIEFTVSYASYSESSEKATVYLEAEDSDAADAWDDLNSSTIEDDVTDICEEVVDIFDDAGISLEEVRTYLYDYDDNRLDYFTYYVDDETLE
ncbi:copper amine oxidase N-terminal domain-containing protein [Moorella sp. E308F]|uniref:copper amine oxidase N-terminal domain-containing protein n=1 Tax=Moorella sp. E308F TaxID=2572682 RepID=UPI00155A83F2|nr:copper amine oxidase N-terminal domain-containing protein [Moorella sp. E308F]